MNEFSLKNETIVNKVNEMIFYKKNEIIVIWKNLPIQAIHLFIFSYINRRVEDKTRIKKRNLPNLAA